MLGVEVMEFLDIENRFASLTSIWKQSAFEVRLFEDQHRALAFSELAKLQSSFKVEEKVFENLELFLRHLHWDLRGYIGDESDSHRYWSDRVSQLNQELASVHGSLDESRKTTASSLLAKLQDLANSDVEYSKMLLQEVELEGTVVVVEKPRQKIYVENLLSKDPKYSDVTVLSLRALFVADLRDSQKVILLAAPRRISDNFMRALLFGGAISGGNFVCANWLAGPEPQKVKQDLAPGLIGVRKPVLRVFGSVSEATSGYSDSDFNNFAQSPVHGEFSQFTESGPTDCRLIEIAGGYVMPVELEASKVSVLRLNDDGALDVQYREPGKTLEPGDILFELRDGAEEDFLMDTAQVKMGRKFNEFARGRREWKSRIASEILESGYDAVVTRLKASGVSTAENLKHWLDNPDFTTPRATSDWRNLLKAVRFSDAEENAMALLGSELRASLIAIGKEARQQMADSVSDKDLDQINSHNVVTKQLDEYGDAVFVLGMVLSLGSEVKKCEPHEIRRVLRK